MTQLITTIIVAFFTWLGYAFVDPREEAQWNPSWEGRSAAEQPSGSFSPDGNLFAYYPGQALGISDGKAVVERWEVATQKPLKNKTVPLCPGEIPEQIIYTPSGDLQLLICRAKASAVDDEGFRNEDIFTCLLNVDTQQRTPYIKVGPYPLAVCPRGERLAYSDGVWELATGRKLTCVLLPKKGLWTVNTCFSPDGSHLAYELAMGARDVSLLYIVDPKSGKKLSQIGNIDFEQDILSYEFDPLFSQNGRAVVSRTYLEGDPVIAIRESATGKVLHSISQDDLERVLGLSSDNAAVLTWQKLNHKVTLRDIVTGRVTRTILLGDDVKKVVYSAEHETLAIIQGKRVEFLRLAE